MNLVRSELMRLVSRRFTLVLVVILLGAFAVTLATAMASTHRPSPEALAVAEQRADQDRERLTRELDQCLAAGPDPRFADCEWIRPDAVHVEDYLNNVFVFSRSIQDLVFFLVGYLCLFGFLVGASYVGAELTSGGMTNLLLWRPQRLAVLGTKLGVLLGAVLALSVAATAVYLVTFWTLANQAGFTGRPSGEFWAELALVIARGQALALICAALGFGVATLGRHTSAAVGLLAGYAVVWELGARIVMEIVETPRTDQWFLSSYIAAWMTGRVGFYDRGCYLPVCDPWYDLTWAHSGGVFGALLVALVGGAFVVFHRRDLA